MTRKLKRTMPPNLIFVQKSPSALASSHVKSQTLLKSSQSKVFDGRSISIDRRITSTDLTEFSNAEQPKINFRRQRKGKKKPTKLQLDVEKLNFFFLNRDSFQKDQVIKFKKEEILKQAVCHKAQQLKSPHCLINNLSLKISSQ